MSDINVVEITTFKKYSYLGNEKCKCSRKATIRVIASYNNNHRHVFCCSDPDCKIKAASLATIRLFVGPRPLSLGPEKYREKGFEVIDNFKINCARRA